MNPVSPTRAMVLAAGYGKRMRPLSDARPKPLIEVHGRPMIDRVLNRLADAGVKQAVVNLHYKGDMLRAHLADRSRPEILFSEEAEILDTGGGIAKALPQLGEDAFYVTNSDVVWLDGLRPALERLASFWDESRMDGLLLLHSSALAFGYEGQGDFTLTPDGQVRRRNEREVAPFVFTGLQILHPRLFTGAPEGAFSLNRLWDRAIEEQRLYGLRHDGLWFHVGTPELLEETEQELSYELGKPRPEPVV
ncbi:nucleotidyltransferase family protein [Fodinicurvata fenggangensis]|uniref:nucleotidyltransferase family protein n=1 Tax=Fodinicurvata fenggangensis TaxID=1121830 RepID=UPI00068FE1EC|nr:nucleotidyltransferase family protein [Fodinicurvata fenggangensis]